MATPTLDRPAPSPSNSPENGGFRRRATVIVGGLALAAAGYFGYQAVADKFGHDPDKIALDTIQESIAEQKGDIYSGDPVQITVERPEGMTADNATPDKNQFFNDRYFTDQERIDWAYNILNQPSDDPKYVGMTLLEAHHSELQEKYNKPGEFKYVEDLVPSSEQMTGDQIFALYAAISDVQLNSDLPLDTRLKLAAAQVDNTTEGGLDYNLENLKNGNIANLNGLQGVNVSTNGQKLESKVFRHHVLSNGYDPAGVPSKIMDAMTNGNDNPVRFQTLIQFRDGKPVTFDGYVFQSSEALDADDILSIPAN